MRELPALLAEDEWSAMVGMFDPLTLIQAERIANRAERGRKVLAVIEPGSETLLSADARAALVASLRVVDAVVIAERAQWRAILSRFSNLKIDEDEEAERARSAQFAEFVLGRQKVAEVLT